MADLGISLFIAPTLTLSMVDFYKTKFILEVERYAPSYGFFSEDSVAGTKTAALMTWAAKVPLRLQLNKCGHPSAFAAFMTTIAGVKITRLPHGYTNQSHTITCVRFKSLSTSRCHYRLDLTRIIGYSATTVWVLSSSYIKQLLLHTDRPSFTTNGIFSEGM